MEGDVDAEVFAPHLLDGLGDDAVFLDCVVEQLHLGESFALGIAGLGEEALRLGEVALDGVAALEAEEIGRSEVVGGKFLGERDSSHKRLAVDREGERAADADIVKGFSLHVEAIEIDPVVRVHAHRLGLVATVNRELAEGQFVGGVELAGAKHPLLGLGELDRVKVDLVNLHGRAVPVGGGAHGDDFLVGAPLLEHVGAVADKALRARPSRALAVEGAEFFQRWDMERKPRVVVHRMEKKRRGLAQREPKCARIDGLETRLRKVGEIALVEVLRAHDVPEHVGILGGDRRREDALVALHKVGGRDRIAVGPLGVGAEVERVGEPVGRDVPFLRDSRDNIKLRTLADEPLEEGEGETVLRHARDDLEIELLRLGAVADVQDFFRRLRLGRVGGRF